MILRLWLCWLRWLFYFFLRIGSHYDQVAGLNRNKTMTSIPLLIYRWQDFACIYLLVPFFKQRISARVLLLMVLSASEVASKQCSAIVFGGYRLYQSEQLLLVCTVRYHGSCEWRPQDASRWTSLSVSVCWWRYKDTISYLLFFSLLIVVPACLARV